MNYQEFKDYIKENIKEFLPEKFQRAKMEIQEITKNNNMKLDCLVVKSPENNIYPTININNFFKEYEEGMKLSCVLEEIAAIRESYEIQKNVSAVDFFDFERAKDSIESRWWVRRQIKLCFQICLTDWKMIWQSFIKFC